MPTYHLANVVDDYLMKITHVIRGEEWLPSAPLHVLLYRFLGWENEMPHFAHLPLLLKPDGNGKLSKRDGDRLGFPVFPLEWTDPLTGEKSSGYREKGYFPEAVVNLLALLGWNPGSNQEIFSMEELIEAFSIERISKSGAKFDLNKAKWFNQQYLRAYPEQKLADDFKKVLMDKQLDFPLEYIQRVIHLIKEKAHFIHEFWDLSAYFFRDPQDYDSSSIEKKWNAEASAFIQNLNQKLGSIDDFSLAHIEAAYQESAQDMSIKPGSMMQITRVALTGLNLGPSLFETMQVLGKKTNQHRLDLAISNFPKP
jgi:glutamyl-tRNA synthetase